MGGSDIIKISPYEFKYKKNNNLLIDYDRTRLEEELVGSFLDGNQNFLAINNNISSSKFNKIILPQYNNTNEAIQKFDIKAISIKNLHK